MRVHPERFTKERLGRTKQSKSKVGLKMLESVEDAREEWVFV